MNTEPHLILTRPLAEAERSATMLREAGFRLTLAPAMTIEPLRCAPLSAPPQGVLLTSQHAAPALRKLRVLRQTPLFAVGEATAEAARTEGYTRVRVASGHAMSLIPVVKAKLPAPASLAYLRGAEVRHDLQTLLTAEGYAVEDRRVYRALPAATLPDEALAALRGDVQGILFYSARTVEAFAALAPEGWQRHLAITVSEAVAETARQAGCPRVEIVPLHHGVEALDALKTLFS